MEISGTFLPSKSLSLLCLFQGIDCSALTTYVLSLKNFRTSYSPLMAEHLSYLKSKSHSYVYKVEKKRVVQADENFAREVMQLFSMGLILLNDGA